MNARGRLPATNVKQSRSTKSTSNGPKPFLIRCAPVNEGPASGQDQGGRGVARPARQAGSRLCALSPGHGQSRPERSARRRQLQQAVLTSARSTGKEAERLYRSLFAGDRPPNLEVAVEYALLQMRIPAMKAKGMATLESLNRQYPGEPRVRSGLVRHYLADGRRQQALGLLREMAQDDNSRGGGRDLAR